MQQVDSLHHPCLDEESVFEGCIKEERVFTKDKQCGRGGEDELEE